MTELVPKRTSFLFDRVVRTVIAASALAVGLGIAAVATGLPGLLGLAAAQLVGFVAFSLVAASVAWTKERYELHEHRLVAHSGGLTSDRTLALDLRNVTHVKQHLPWIRYRFFDVGDVIVQSAGSSSAEVVFRSVPDPDGLTALLRTRLQANGFALTGQTLLRRESPSRLGALVECASIGGGILVFLGWSGLGAMGAGAASAGGWGLLAAGLGTTVAVSGVGLWLVLHYLDLLRRTYEVFDDVVEYREGFLSRTNAFIPVENLADVGTRQTFFDQILGLYDVKVSCQGSGSEVAFRRLAGGREMQAAIRSLVDTAQARRDQAALAARETPPDPLTATESPAASARPAAERVPADQAWTADLRMHTVRALLGKGLLRGIGTRYTVGAASVASRYELIGQQQLEFAYDKVTGVQVRTGPVDALFGTFTVRIWSIGSSTPLDLAHVRRSDVNLGALLRQAGIPGGAPLATLPAALGPGVWLRAHWRSLIFVGVVCGAGGITSAVSGESVALLGLLTPLLWLGSFPVAVARARRQQTSLHEHHLEHRSGLFYRSHIYARYDDIKKLEVRRYPGGTAGHLRVFVAGETAVQTKNGKSGAVVQNSFTAHYLPDVTPLPQTLDPLLLGRLAPSEVLSPVAAPDPGQAYRPRLANSLVPLLVLSVPLPPLLLLIPATILGVRRRVYRVEADRVVREEGVLDRTHTSVLFDRIDSLDQGQGPLGKLFGNGTVTLMTAGSSRPDLVLANAPGHQALYDQVQARYGA